MPMSTHIKSFVRDVWSTPFCLDQSWMAVFLRLEICFPLIGSHTFPGCMLFLRCFNRIAFLIQNELFSELQQSPYPLRLELRSAQYEFSSGLLFPVCLT